MDGELAVAFDEALTLEEEVEIPCR